MVFPAHTGVFPLRKFVLVLKLRLPRTHGGVSIGVYDLDTLYKSSPHTRGCFRYTTEDLQNAIVFPAHTGVFLYSIRS